MRSQFLVLICSVIMASPSPAQRLGVPVQAEVISHDYTNQPVPQYAHGFLLAYDPASSQIWSYRNGSLKTHTIVAIPGVNSVRIRHVSCSPGGVLAASVVLSDPQLGYASVLVWIDSTGKIMRVVRTYPFAAGALAFSSDGTLWVLGRVRDRTYRDLPDYNILRQYSADGVLLRTFLPKSSLLGTPAPGSGRIQIRDQQVLIYFEEDQIVLQLSTDGRIAGQWKLAGASEIMVTGAAISNSGNIILSGDVHSNAPASVSSGLYQLDKVSDRLIPLEMERVGLARDQYIMLLGGEADHLVLYVKPPRRLEWVPVE
ncbi:MAG TPA: hypothetical protein VFA33_01605 [Bryobacteraceae bacterium]|nr:hypothetical protein [Bryobacteraceae bacterium]